VKCECKREGFATRSRDIEALILFVVSLLRNQKSQIERLERASYHRMMSGNY
jgi:hypothetical protein